MKRIILLSILLAGCRHKTVQSPAPNFQEIGSCAPTGKIECTDTTTSFFGAGASSGKPIGDPVPACVQKYEDGSIEFKECPDANSLRLLQNGDSKQ